MVQPWFTCLLTPRVLGSSPWIFYFDVTRWSSVLYLFFPTCKLFFFLFCVNKDFSMKLKRVVTESLSCNQVLVQMAIKYDARYRIFFKVLSSWEKLPSAPITESFFMNRCWILSDAFSPVDVVMSVCWCERLH